MQGFIITSGKKIQGRLLAHDERHALKQAAAFWGSGQKYTAKPVGADPTTDSTTTTAGKKKAKR